MRTILSNISKFDKKKRDPDIFKNILKVLYIGLVSYFVEMFQIFLVQRSPAESREENPILR